MVGSGYREMSMGQKLKGWRLRREATGNTPHVRKAEDDEEGGMARRFKHGLEVFKVRSENVFGGGGRSEEKELESGRGSMV